MQIRALRTFDNKNKLGLVREGMVVTVDDHYGRQLIRSKLAELIQPAQDKSLPGPDKTKDVPGNEKRDDAPAGSSQGEDGEQTRQQLEPESGETDNSSEDQPAGGRRRRSSSPRRARRSPKLK